MKKVFVLGIDCAPPELIFDRWIDELPNLKKLKKNGSYGVLKSSIPPLTCLAWTSFVSSKTASNVDIFDYTYRNNHSYDDLRLISSRDIKADTLWDMFTKIGKKSIILNVPLTYPPKEIDGYMVTDFLTPDTSKDFTHPKEFKKELLEFLKEDYMLDVYGYRTRDRNELLKDIYKMTEIHFKTIKYMMNKKWDFFMAVILGTDRIQHTFWKYFDEGHKQFEDNPELKDAIKDYYKYIDKEIGEILDKLDGNTVLIIASDHGAKRMGGRVNFSDWLIKENYLVLKNKVKERSKLEMSNINWDKTKAFATGAFEAQVFVNLKGREPEGIVDEKDYEKLINELTKKIKDIRDEDGNKLNTIVFRKEDIFNGKYKEKAPDLLVYFDNLSWGVNCSAIGNEGLHSWATLVGPDDSVHSSEGLFLIFDKSRKGKGNIGERNILDMAPTILEIMNLKIPKDFEGKTIKW